MSFAVVSVEGSSGTEESSVKVLKFNHLLKCSASQSIMPFPQAWTKRPSIFKQFSYTCLWMKSYIFCLEFHWTFFCRVRSIKKTLAIASGNGLMLNRNKVYHGPLSRYVKLWIVHAPGMPETFSPPPQISVPDMHHDTFVTRVAWCVPGSLTSGFLWSWGGENVPDIPSACATRNFTSLVRGPLIGSLDGMSLKSIYK